MRRPSNRPAGLAGGAPAEPAPANRSAGRGEARTPPKASESCSAMLLADCGALLGGAGEVPLAEPEGGTRNGVPPRGPLPPSEPFSRAFASATSAGLAVADGGGAGAALSAESAIMSGVLVAQPGLRALLVFFLRPPSPELLGGTVAAGGGGVERAAMLGITMAGTSAALGNAAAPFVCVVVAALLRKSNEDAGGEFSALLGFEGAAAGALINANDEAGWVASATGFSGMSKPPKLPSAASSEGAAPATGTTCKPVNMPLTSSTPRPGRRWHSGQQPRRLPPSRRLLPRTRHRSLLRGRCNRSDDGFSAMEGCTARAQPSGALLALVITQCAWL